MRILKFLKNVQAAELQVYWFLYRVYKTADLRSNMD